MKLRITSKRKPAGAPLGPLDLLTAGRNGAISLLILASIFVNSIVDLFGLALVVPVIGIVIRPETIDDNEWVAKAYDISQSFGIDGANPL